jgi:predicted metal-dependent hydrolase
MKKRTVTIASEEIPVDIVRSSRRTVALYVRPGGTLQVRAPWYVPVSLLMQFVKQKSRWIERHLSGGRNASPPSGQQLIVNGSTIPFMGRQITVKVTAGSRNRALLKDDELLLTLSGETSGEKITAVTDAWYHQQAKAFFPRRTLEMAAIYRTKLPEPRNISVRKMRRRWGTCHSNGNIWFNRELIKRDPELIDYVIIHELCHLVHHNHGREYYELLGSIIPEFRKLRQILRN